MDTIDYQTWFNHNQYASLIATLEELKQQSLIASLEKKLPLVLNQCHKDYPLWFQQLIQLPGIKSKKIKLNDGRVDIQCLFDQDFNDKTLKAFLQGFKPWRKGPFQINSVHIDSEWRSDYKWERIRDALGNLEYKNILDVGCGNGYHCFRMHMDKAALVVGIDPSWHYLLQFQLIKHFYGHSPLYLLPLGLESLPANIQLFDLVFSMGVFYHRRSPIDHLMKLKQMLHKDGRLVLETLIIDGEQGSVLLPEDRYAKMRNVWFIPTIDTLYQWLKRCGYHSLELININQTSFEEQRKTEWMDSESLSDFLDPDNPDKTIEGYPAPKRATILAKR